MDLNSYQDSRHIGNKELADMLGISGTAVANYRNGKRLPNLKIGRKIEIITKNRVRIDDLIEFWENKRCRKTSVKMRGGEK